MMKNALVLACDDNFIAYASVVARRAAMLSSDSFPIIIVSDGVSEENKKLASRFCPRMAFVEAGHLFGDRTFFTRTTFTRATYLRLFFDEILPDLDRVVYIDCDMSPLVDMSPLLAIVPRSSPVVATFDMAQQFVATDTYERLPLDRSAGYLQGGVQIFDLKAMRSEGLFKAAISFVLENPETCQLVDQDAMNVVLQGRWQVLDWRWNVTHFERQHMPRPHYLRHITATKPWSHRKAGIERFIVRQWCYDLRGSPWPDKFLPDSSPFKHGYVHPVLHRIETTVKRLVGRKERDRRLATYIRNLPVILHEIDTASGAGRLATETMAAIRSRVP